MQEWYLRRIATNFDMKYKRQLNNTSSILWATLVMNIKRKHGYYYRCNATLGYIRLDNVAAPVPLLRLVFMPIVIQQIRITKRLRSFRVSIDCWP